MRIEAPTESHTGIVVDIQDPEIIDGLEKHKLQTLAPSPQELKCKRIHSLLLLVYKEKGKGHIICNCMVNLSGVSYSNRI